MQLNAPAAARSRGVTLVAALLVAIPLVQWAFLSALSYFTILEPPFTTSRGLPLAMQLFFTSAGIVPTCLGVGLLYRSEWARRISCVAFALLAFLATWTIAAQVLARRLDSSILLALWALALSAGCLWYFMRTTVRAEFRPLAQSKVELQAMPPRSEAPPAPALVVMAWGEIVLGLLAALLLVYLHIGFGARPLLDVGPGIGVTEADELLRRLLFVAFALLLAPHALTTAASVGILLRRDTLRVARRYLVIACRLLIGAALVAAWLGWREGFAYDARSVWTIWAFCAVALAWHVRFLHALGRDGKEK